VRAEISMKTDVWNYTKEIWNENVQKNNHEVVAHVKMVEQVDENVGEVNVAVHMMAQAVRAQRDWQLVQVCFVHEEELLLPQRRNVQFSTTEAILEYCYGAASRISKAEVEDHCEKVLAVLLHSNRADRPSVGNWWRSPSTQSNSAQHTLIVSTVVE